MSKNIKSRALWFINQEIEPVLRELESGIVSKDQAIGSLNTVFNISSDIKDINHMKTICKLIGYIRSTTYYSQINKLYVNNYFNESHINSVHEAFTGMYKT